MKRRLARAARRALAALFPSVPYRDQARLLAAMQDPFAPVSGPRGEARPEAGPHPESGAGDAPPTPHAAPLSGLSTPDHLRALLHPATRPTTTHVPLTSWEDPR